MARELPSPFQRFHSANAAARSREGFQPCERIRGRRCCMGAAGPKGSHAAGTKKSPLPPAPNNRNSPIVSLQWQKAGHFSVIVRSEGKKLAKSVSGEPPPSSSSTTTFDDASSPHSCMCQEIFASTTLQAGDAKGASLQENLLLLLLRF